MNSKEYKNLDSEERFQEAINEIEKIIKNVNSELSIADIEIKKLNDLLRSLYEQRQEILKKVSANSVKRNKLTSCYLKFRFPSIKAEDEQRSKN